MTALHKKSAPRSTSGNSSYQQGSASQIGQLLTDRVYRCRKRRMFHQSPKWHEGDKWARLLSIYDGIAQEQYGQGTSRLVSTTFGDTQIHARGNPQQDDVLVFFHGIATNSLMFGDWLIPQLCHTHYCVAIDTVGDMGRSLPRDGDPANGPKDEREMADWAIQVFEQLNLNKNGERRVSIVGYSFGAVIATCVGRYYPDTVNKLVLMAPAGVVAPVRSLWLLQAITFALLSKMASQDGAWAASLRKWFFGSMLADAENMKNLKYPELREATDAVGGPQVKVRPDAVDVDILTEMVQACPTLMVIGQQESVIDPVVAIETATKANMKVKVYENAGHMFFAEHPREPVIEELQAFLSS